MSQIHNNPNCDKLLRIFQIELTIDSDMTGIVDSPPVYLDNESWNVKLQKTYEALQEVHLRRQRIKGLLYAFDIGRLLLIIKLPVTQWKEFVKQNSVSEPARVCNTCIQIYSIFQQWPDQIFKTHTFSYNIISHLNQWNYEILLNFVINILIHR